MQRAKKKSNKLKFFLVQTFQTAVFLAILSIPGMMINYFLLLSPVFGASYLAYRNREMRKIGVSQPANPTGLVLRATIVGIFFTAAFIAPVRGCSYFMVKLTGVERLRDLLRELSLNGVLDTYTGICGVCMAIIAGMVYWRQAMRLKSQIVNIPTAKVRSAAMGIAEFKGIARQIPDADQRLTKKYVDWKDQEFVRKDGVEDAGEPIIYYRYWPGANRKRITETILSRFYLEDDTGKILVDPRNAEHWDGKGHFFVHPTRHFFIREDDQDRLMRVPGTDYFEKTDNSVLHQLLPGDEVYLLGSVEENSEADHNAFGPDRLIVRPASTLHETNPINRIMFGEAKETGRDIFSLFFLTDLQEQEARKMLTRGMGTVWLWVLGWVALSLQPLIADSSKFFDGQSFGEGLRALFRFLP